MGNNAPIVIEGARLIDGKSDKPLTNATILIQGNRVTRVTPGKIEFPKEARRIDARGKTVLPGLIDNHVHYRSYCGELFLAHGVTSVRDLGNPLEWIQAQKDAATAGKIAGPRIFCAGGGFYGRATAEHHTVVSTPEAARQMARGLIDRKVDYIKIHLGVSLDIVRAIAEEAHASGLRVTGHLDSSIVPYAEAGIDGVEHATGCAEDTIRSEAGRKKLASIRLWLAKFLGPWTLAEEEHFPALVEFLAKKSTFIEPTIVLWGAALGMREKWEREDYELLRNPGLSYLSEHERLLWLDHYYLAYGARIKNAPEQDAVIGNRYSIYGILPEEQLRDGFRRLGEFLSQLAKAGGHVVTGTDATAVMPGISLHRDMELLVSAGLSPMQAIKAATSVGANYLGKSDALGTVEEGKLADLIIIKGDPLTDITRTRQIETVIKDGAIVDTSYHASFFNPFPRSHSREFYGYPIPKLERIFPTVVRENDATMELILKGKDFYPSSVVWFDTSPVATRFISQTELTASIPSYLIKVGVVPVTVVNQKPHETPDRGGTSNDLPFIVKFSPGAQAT
ncbi:MAG TPA: amidohydrolase family protein [Candidatus Binatia bacterium]|nr:amidohydrolase family protein [Candidatus Binatia bacterium]